MVPPPSHQEGIGRPSTTLSSFTMHLLRGGDSLRRKHSEEPRSAAPMHKAACSFAGRPQLPKDSLPPAACSLKRGNRRHNFLYRERRRDDRGDTPAQPPPAPARPPLGQRNECCGRCPHARF